MNKTQFHTWGKEEAEVVALYAATLQDKLKELGWAVGSGQLIQAAMPAIVEVVSNKRRT
jgi:hypothetical protein